MGSSVKHWIDGAVRTGHERTLNARLEHRNPMAGDRDRGSGVCETGSDDDGMETQYGSDWFYRRATHGVARNRPNPCEL